MNDFLINYLEMENSIRLKLLNGEIDKKQADHDIRGIRHIVEMLMQMEER